jgi:cytochrome c oxidase subunit II
MTLTSKHAICGLLAALAALAPARSHAGESGPTVRITASKFRFTPDHIVLVKGQPVTLQLTSLDATHGFLIRALNIDTDIKPRQVTAMTVTPATAGTFKAICDHYCGLGHGGMKMTIVVQDASAKSSPGAAIASAAGVTSK